MPRKPAQEQGDTLVNIEQQAFALFGRYGYEGVSIGDIAKRTKLSKGALYWHFPGKEALFLRCQEKIHGLFNEYIFHPMRAETRPGLGMLRLFEGLEMLLRDPRIKGGVTGYWLIPSTPETGHIADAQRAFEQAAVATVQESLQRGEAAGLFNLGGDAEVMSRAIISIVEAVVLPLRDQSAEEVHRILAVLAKTLFRAYGDAGAVALVDRFAANPDLNLPAGESV